MQPLSVEAHGNGYPAYPPQRARGISAGLVLGVTAAMALSICGCIVGIIWWRAASVRQAAQSQFDQGNFTSSNSRSTSSSGATARTSPASTTTSYVPKTVDEALAALQSGDSNRLRYAANFLANYPVDVARRTNVERALATCLGAGYSSQADELMPALERWGTAESAPAVATALTRERFKSMLPEAIDFLTKTGHTSEADAVAKHLSSSSAGEAAVRYLQAVGPSAQAVVVAHLGNAAAEERVRRVLTSYGVSVDDMLLERRLAGLKSGSDSNLRAAAAELAAARVAAEHQPRVARAIEQAIRGEGASSSAKENLVRALRVWGDKESVPVLGTLLDDYGARDEAIDALVALNDPGAAQYIAPKLGDYSFGPKAAAALKKLGPETKPHILALLNESDDRRREQARQVLAEMGVAQQELVAQTLEDLRSLDSKRHRGAVEWLAAAPIEPEQRSAVADELVRHAFGSDFFVKRSAVKALARWGTKDQAAHLLSLLDSRESDVMRMALVNLLTIEDPTLAPNLARRLGARLADRSVRDLARLELQKVGAAAEDALIGLLNSDFEGEVVLMAAELLELAGTEKSLPALQRMASYARSKKAPVIADTCTRAMAAIRLRTAPPEPAKETPEAAR
jgi:hypothetical protein